MPATDAPLAATPSVPAIDRRGRIAIGLVNNMPDAAVAATERQFSRLIEAASGEHDVVLRLYGLDSVPRSEAMRARMARSYGTLDALKAAPPDALIVTGAEPLAASLDQEPYWPALTDLLDWADRTTISTLLSCLAAHAAALHFDGIVRRPLPAKRSGVFDFSIVADHPLAAGLGGSYRAPHSRHNGLDCGELERAGYSALSVSEAGDVDLFVRQRGCLWVCVQGHPEYEADTLAREYKRDLGRFRRGERALAPALPEAYFPAGIARRIEAFAAQRPIAGAGDAMEDFPALGGFDEPAPWSSAAATIYRNWIGLIAQRKQAGQAHASLLGGGSVDRRAAQHVPC